VVPKAALASPAEQQKLVAQGAKDALARNSLDAILCVSGGWAGGNANCPDLLQSAHAMVSSSLYASLIAAHLAGSDQGLMKASANCLMLPGAAPLVGNYPGTAFMTPYGVAKAGVHQLLASLADRGTAGIADTTKVFGIAPVTIDTEMNRQGMPDADFTSWTTCEELAAKMEEWVGDVDGGVEHGKMYLVKTAGGVTTYE
jgi:dihydropteridine reductase